MICTIFINLHFVEESGVESGVESEWATERRERERAGGGGEGKTEAISFGVGADQGSKSTWDTGHAGTHVGHPPYIPLPLQTQSTQTQIKCAHVEMAAFSSSRPSAVRNLRYYNLHL